MKLFYVCTFLILFFSIIPSGNATEEMAEKTGKDCSYCHLDQSGGGKVKTSRFFSGKRFLKKSRTGRRSSFSLCLSTFSFPASPQWLSSGKR
jgi:hypothetical protein